MSGRGKPSRSSMGSGSRIASQCMNVCEAQEPGRQRRGRCSGRLDSVEGTEQDVQPVCKFQRCCSSWRARS